MSDLYAIGELARRTGLASSALRYYERVGLLLPGVRAGGRRHYTPSSTDHVAWIRLCRMPGSHFVRSVRCWPLAVGAADHGPA